MADTQGHGNEVALRTLATQVANLSLSLALSEQATEELRKENEGLRMNLQDAQAAAAQAKLSARSANPTAGGDGDEAPAV